jgi:putative tryptophan/tyrosine transport system substrate-binding protein
VIRRLLLFCLPLAAALAHVVCAQPSDHVRLVGSLAFGATSPNDPIYDEVRKGLRELGWADGRDFRIEHRTAEGHLDRLLPLAAELVRLKVDAIVTGNDEATRAARQATSSIPIVALLYNHDPVASGFIQSFNRPGGNITGVTVRDSELAAKRLELLKEMLPALSRLAVFWDSPARAELAVLQQAARSIGVHLHLIKFQPPGDIAAMFANAKAQRADAVMVLHAPQFYVNRNRIGALSRKYMLPTCSSFWEIIEAGGLMSYSTDTRDQYHRGAYFIDRIFRGAKPSELPFEEASNAKLVVNVRTAEVLKLTIPQSILLAADKAIK